MFVKVKTVSPVRDVMINLSSIETIVYDDQIGSHTIYLSCGKQLVVENKEVHVVIENLEFVEQ
jgi:uncharacterized protein YlzI (FlbEa/FlbD family)